MFESLHQVAGEFPVFASDVSSPLPLVAVNYAHFPAISFPHYIKPLWSLGIERCKVVTFFVSDFARGGVWSCAPARSTGAQLLHATRRNQSSSPQQARLLISSYHPLRPLELRRRLPRDAPPRPWLRSATIHHESAGSSFSSLRFIPFVELQAVVVAVRVVGVNQRRRSNNNNGWFTNFAEQVPELLVL